MSAAPQERGDTVRRRGQGLSPNLSASPNPDAQVLRSPSLLSNAQDHGTAFDLDTNVPSIILVPSASDAMLPSASVPQLPLLPFSADAKELPALPGREVFQMDETCSKAAADTASDICDSYFSIPVGSIPQASGLGVDRSLSQRSAASSTHSSIPSLPTPNFDTHGDEDRTPEAVQPLLSRTLVESTSNQHHLNRSGMRLVSDHVQSMSRAGGQAAAAALLRQNSTSSCDTVTSSTASVDSTNVEYNPKLTQKWPKPRSMRSLAPPSARRPGIRSVSSTLRRMEGGMGRLGIESMGRWTPHKWWLIISVLTVLGYGVTALMFCLRTWFKTWAHADAFLVTDGDLLILLTLSGSILIFVAMIGFSGCILNSRPILAVYALLLWPALISMLVVGYISYKRYTFNLDSKLSMAWSEYYTDLGRLVIQNSLSCCGFYNVAHDSVPSTKCFIRTSLPGCKGKLYRLERANLAAMWSSVFGVVPVHLLNIVISLVCSNHVTRTFGKGIMPKQYRLTMRDVQESRAKLAETTSVYLSRPTLSRFTSSRGTLREDKQS